MKFITRQNDPWHTETGEDVPIVKLTPHAHSLLTLAQWHAIRNHWPEGMPVAVSLANDVDVRDIVPDLPRIGMVSSLHRRNSRHRRGVGRHDALAAPEWRRCRRAASRPETIQC